MRRLIIFVFLIDFFLPTRSVTSTIPNTKVFFKNILSIHFLFIFLFSFLPHSLSNRYLNAVREGGKYHEPIIGLWKRFFFFSGYFKAVWNPVICQSLLAEYSKRNRIVMCVCTRSRVGLTKGGGNDVHCDRRQTMCVCIFTHHIRALALSSCHSNKPDCVKSFCLSKD